MVCDPCDGNGAFDLETGEVLNKEEWVIALLALIKKKDKQLAWYAEKLPAKKQGHWDEFNEIHGGRQRFD